MPKNSLKKLPPLGALLTMRMTWGAIVFSQVVFLGILVLFIMPTQKPRPVQPTLVWANIVMLVTAIPMTFALRKVAFRRTEVDGRIPVPVYARANLIFWAGCESVSFFGMIVAMINNTLWPTILVVILALALQALTFPQSTKVAAQ